MQSAGSAQCDSDPAKGLSCDFLFSGLCKPPGEEGDACGGPAIAPCRENLACHATQPDGIGTCGGLPALGDSCGDRCASPAVCTTGVCRNPARRRSARRATAMTSAPRSRAPGSCRDAPSAPANGFSPRCVGAGVTAGNVTGFGGKGGTGGFGGTFSTGFGGIGGRRPQHDRSRRRGRRRPADSARLRSSAPHLRRVRSSLTSREPTA